MNSVRDDPKGPGFPIRKSTDQRVLAPPRGLSQRATSFIASVRQGIHQMPLKRLIQRNPSRPGTNFPRHPQRHKKEAEPNPQSGPKAAGPENISERNSKSDFDSSPCPPDQSPATGRFKDPARALQPPQACPAIKPSRPRSQKPLTTQFRSTLSNNNGQQRP